MKRRECKWAIRILCASPILFAVLILLLYIPPVQQLLRKELSAYASQATGMQISLERIDLRFPLNLLVQGVSVVQAPDTLLSIGRLDVRVQAWPLLRGEVEVDRMTLSNARVNSGNLIQGMQLRGVLGEFVFESHGIDLIHETVLINHAALSDTDIFLVRPDTTEVPPDSASAPLKWRVELQALQLNRVSFALQMPTDSMQVTARIAKADLKGAELDLAKSAYALKRLLLTGGSVSYDVGQVPPTTGFDPSHIALRDIRLGLDSLFYRGNVMRAVLSECSLNERSGLAVTSLTGRLLSSDTLLAVSGLKLLTPHSEVRLAGNMNAGVLHGDTRGYLAAQLNAMIGKQDVLLLSGSLPDAFKKAYPFHPLEIRAGIAGDLQQLRLSHLTATLPGAFNLTGKGELSSLTDSLQRAAELEFTFQGLNLQFLTTLAGSPPQPNFIIPDSMQMVAHLGMHGSQYTAQLKLVEQQGTIQLDANLDADKERYKADLKVDGLQLNHFLPKDSLYELSLSIAAQGEGLDLTSRRTKASIRATVDELHYADYYLSKIAFDAQLQETLVTANLVSRNDLLSMVAQGAYKLGVNHPDGWLKADVSHIDLYELRLAPKAMKRPLLFSLQAEAGKELLEAHLVAGDLKLDFKSPSGVNPLLKKTGTFLELLNAQIESKMLNHKALREALPPAVFSFQAGQENPLAWYLETHNISYHDMRMQMKTNAQTGINGRATIHALHVDTLQLDTLSFTIRQDTAALIFRGGVINAPGNPQRTFKAELTGEIRTKDAELLVNYENEQGETGLLLGLNVHPSYDEKRGTAGLVFRVTPEEPIVAFRKFRFEERQNWLYLHKNSRVYANVHMIGPNDMAFRVQSIREDTLSLQNLDIEIRRIPLAELSRMLPYLPELSGLFSADAHYIQTEQSLSVSTEATIDEFTYASQRVGDITLGLTWLPGEEGRQYVNGYLTHDKTEVLIADGSYHPTPSGRADMEVNSTITHFPCKMVNAFIPDQQVALSGDIDGELQLTGNTERPLFNGQLMLDSVSLSIRQAGARFVFDNRPVPITNSRAEFNRFAIFTTSKNPFTIDGYVDFRELSRSLVNLNMEAKNYTLLDAKRTKESLVYGKALVDFKSTLRGPLDQLVMRGNTNLLGSTDLTYVMIDSPLGVQDRLSELVTFTQFSDTTVATKQEIPTVSLGGLDMLMTLQIDPSVVLKVDLNEDRSNRVELKGGGHLSLRYTPQADLSVSGRYTLTGGVLKYALPIIPLKEFVVNNGSYMEWTGNPMDPLLNLTATERMRSSVSSAENAASRMVNFDVSVVVKNRLDDLSLAFDISAPEDAAVQNQLVAMGAEERNKQAIAMLVTGLYLAAPGSSGGLNMGAALNSVLSSQINALVGDIKNASLSVGVEANNTEIGSTQTNYSFRYSQRFFNDRVQVVLGGKVATGANVTNDVESFIDNVSLEYRLDRSGMRYVRLFHDKNYDSILEGEITETGVGLVLHKKMDRLGELFIFKSKKR